MTYRNYVLAITAISTWHPEFWHLPTDIAFLLLVEFSGRTLATYRLYITEILTSYTTSILVKCCFLIEAKRIDFLWPFINFPSTMQNKDVVGHCPKRAHMCAWWVQEMCARRKVTVRAREHICTAVWAIGGTSPKLPPILNVYSAVARART